MQIDLDPDVIQQYLEILGAIGTGLVAFGAVWWRFSKWVHVLDTYQEKSNEQIMKLADSNLELTKAVTVMSVKLDEREKDTLKLEGAIEGQRRDISDATKSLERVSASLNGLWRTLQNLYPDQVPRRLSDE